MCLAGVSGWKGELRNWGEGREGNQKSRGRGHMSRSGGETTSHVWKLILTDGQPEAALEFVLLVVEEGSHG